MKRLYCGCLQHALIHAHTGTHTQASININTLEKTVHGCIDEDLKTTANALAYFKKIKTFL